MEKEVIVRLTMLGLPRGVSDTPNTQSRRKIMIATLTIVGLLICWALLGIGNGKDSENPE